MTNANDIRIVTLYSLGHFAMDFACAFFMLSLISTSNALAPITILLYNFCAFALQMPAGVMADKLNKNGYVAVCGFALVLLSVAFYGAPILFSVILGIGNALFHIGGGIDILNISSDKEWKLGIFVAPGAVGLFLGGSLARSGIVSFQMGASIIFVFLILISLCILSLCSPKRMAENAHFSISPSGKNPTAAFILLFSVVVLRSFVGTTQAFAWQSGFYSTLAVIFLALGKLLGGFSADKLGEAKTSLITLSLSAALYLFSDNAVCGLLSVLLFNMTMPLTLFAMARMYRGAKGFAFGALTFALFIGYLPSFFGIAITPPSKELLYALEAVLSLALIFLGLYFAKEEAQR